MSFQIKVVSLLVFVCFFKENIWGGGREWVLGGDTWRPGVPDRPARVGEEKAHLGIQSHGALSFLPKYLLNA